MGGKRCNFCKKSYHGEFTDGVLQGRQSEGHHGSELYGPDRAASLGKPNNGNQSLTLLVRTIQATIGVGRGDLSYTAEGFAEVLRKLQVNICHRTDGHQTNLSLAIVITSYHWQTTPSMTSTNAS